MDPHFSKGIRSNNQKAVPGMQLPAPLSVTVLHFVKGRIVPWRWAAVTFSAPAGSWVTSGTANKNGWAIGWWQ